MAISVYSSSFINYTGTGSQIDPFVLNLAATGNVTGAISIVADSNTTVNFNFSGWAADYSDFGIYVYTNLFFQNNENDFSVFGTVTLLAGQAINISIINRALSPASLTGSIFSIDQLPPVSPYSLTVLAQPYVYSSGSSLSQQPSIGILDQFGNQLTNYETTVEASLVVLSGSATLTGTTTVSTVNGVADFTDLVITGNGLFYLHFESLVISVNAVDSNQLFFPPDPGNPNPPIPVKPKRSYVVGSVPTANDLEINEFAINVADRKGYMRDSNDIVHLLFDGYASGGGGSGGTVYSVGVSSQDLTVTNSPITSSGFIGLELNTQSVTAGAYGDASNVAEVTVNDKGIVTGIQNVAISYPVNSITAGTDISLTGTAPDYTINNTAPDQIVSLTSGTGVSVTGTYPNFTIDCTITQYTDTDARLALSAGAGISYDNTTGVISNSDPDQIVSLTAGTGINVTGTYPSFTIDSTITQYTDADARLALSAGTGISYDNTTGVITNSDPDQVVSLTAGTDISVTGTYPNFTIDYTGTPGTGTVTSVGITSTAAALTITNTPITTSGNIGVNFSGKGSEYVTGDGSLKTFPTIIEQALELITEVYNSTGATLTKGTVVRINGGQGNLPTITKAQADSDANSAQTYGVVQDDITNNNNGYVVVIGMLNDLDTQAYSAGTQLYLSPTTAGAWTSTKPSAPSHLVYVGVVVRSHPTQGVVEIKIQNGYELDELHDVSITSVAPNNILRYNSTTKLWENVAGTTSSISEGSNLYYTDARARASVSSGTGISYSSTTGVITNSSPDQTVVLTAGTGISTSGTYPNFTITNSSPDQTVKITAGTGIGVTGTYPNFTITNSSPSSGGTVTSVDMTVPTGFKVSGNPVTTTGTLAVVYDTGYALPTTASQTNWDSAYTQRLQWDGGSTNLVAGTGRTSLGATTVGSNFFTLTNPTAVTFPRINADNTVSTLDAATFRTAIGAGTSSTTGTVTSVAALTLGTTGTDLSSSVATGTTTPVITLNVPTASATNRGALSTTDWSNFNTAYTNRITSLTTTGSSGSATLTSNTLNVPTYTLAGLGGIKLTDLSSTATGLTYTNTTGVFSFTAGYSIPTTSSQTNWDSAYSERRQWDGGSTNLVAATGRTSLGATTVGANLFTLTNPSAITFLKINADNTITAESASTFRTSIGAGTGSGTVTSIATTSPITGGTITGSGTIGINSSSTNTASYVVQRDASGNFSAGTITASLTGTASTATNLAGGGAGQIPYQSASGTTAMLAAGTSGQILTSAGAASPTWANQGLFSGGRLTLESGVPVSTSDQTSKTTIYYTPYNGDRISLYDGTNWATYTFTERSLALGTLTSGKNYDVFLYNNSGTLTLELSAAWTNDTTRADALTLANNGIYVKSSLTTRRYLGTIRTTSTTTTEDSASKRFVWNYNNRVNCLMFKQYAASTWTWGGTANTYRYLGNNSANSLAFVNGIREDNIFVMAVAGSSGSGIQRQLAIGFDSEWSATLAGNSTAEYEATAVQAEASNESYQAFANRIPGLGYHVAYALELQNSTTTVSYFGGIEAGITANWRY